MTLGLASVDYGDEPTPDRPEGAVETPEPTADAVEVEVAPSASQWPAAVWCTALLGAGLLVVGAVLPWAEASSDRASFSSMGIDGNGGATLAAALAIALALRDRAPAEVGRGPDDRRRRARRSDRRARRPRHLATRPTD